MPPRVEIWILDNLIINYTVVKIIVKLLWAEVKTGAFKNIHTVMVFLPSTTTPLTGSVHWLVQADCTSISYELFLF